MRQHHTDRDEIKGLDLNYIELPMSAFDGPSQEQVMTFFRILEEEHGGYYVHCMNGSDRTGTLLALYRVVRQGWKKSLTIKEMESFGNHWIHSDLQDIVRETNLSRLRGKIEKEIIRPTQNQAINRNTGNRTTR